MRIFHFRVRFSMARRSHILPREFFAQHAMTRGFSHMMRRALFSRIYDTTAALVLAFYFSRLRAALRTRRAMPRQFQLEASALYYASSPPP